MEYLTEVAKKYSHEKKIVLYGEDESMGDKAAEAMEKADIDEFLYIGRI